MIKFIGALSVGLLIFASCATPPEVKQLSVAQIGYFDKAIEAVRIQSDALLLAARQIKDQADRRISDTEEKSLAKLENLIVKLSDQDRKKSSKAIIEKTAAVKVKAQKERLKLSTKLNMIKEKSNELEAYLKKMKDVQIALDAYLQSEQAGEQVISNILGSPKVSSLLNSANNLIPKITGTAQELQTLLSGMEGAGK